MGFDLGDAKVHCLQKFPWLHDLPGRTCPHRLNRALGHARRELGQRLGGEAVAIPSLNENSSPAAIQRLRLDVTRHSRLALALAGRRRPACMCRPR